MSQAYSHTLHIVCASLGASDRTRTCNLLSLFYGAHRCFTIKLPKHTYSRCPVKESTEVGERLDYTAMLLCDLLARATQAQAVVRTINIALIGRK